MANRPKLNLLPRSKPKADPVKEVTSKMRNTSIFGSGKPREAQPTDYVEPEGERNRTTSESSGRSRNTSESAQN